MKYNFRNDVRKALAHARSDAVRLGHDCVGTEHMLLGLLRNPDSRAAGLLVGVGVSLESMGEEIEARVPRGHVTLEMGKLPYTARGKKALELAMAEARDLQHAYIDTEHLLLGLLREQKGMAAHVLATFGVTTERVHATMRRDGPPPGPTTPAAGSAFRMELDDRSDRSIYEQIVARVKEAAATGELTPGSRLPAVRQLADQLDIAPGTVARAYSELERLGVVVTDGARGTRIAEAATPSDSRPVDLEQIAGLLRPAAVAAYHMGASAADLKRALEDAMAGIFDE